MLDFGRKLFILKQKSRRVDPRMPEDEKLCKT